MKYFIGSLLTISIFLNIYFISHLKEHIILVRGESLDDKIVISFKSISKPHWEYFVSDSIYKEYAKKEHEQITIVKSDARVFVDNINFATGGD